MANTIDSMRQYEGFHSVNNVARTSKCRCDDSQLTSTGLSLLRDTRYTLHTCFMYIPSPFIGKYIDDVMVLICCLQRAIDVRLLSHPLHFNYLTPFPVQQQKREGVDFCRNERHVSFYFCIQFLSDSLTFLLANIIGLNSTQVPR